MIFVTRDIILSRGIIGIWHVTTKIFTKKN